MAEAMNVLPDIYYFFQGLQLLQFWFAGAWALSVHCWGPDAHPAISVFACLCTFGSHFSGHTIWLIVWSVIVVAILGLHAAVLNHYRRTHGFTHWQLWIVRVVEQCLCPVALPLYGSLTGISLRETIRTALSGAGVDAGQVVLFFVGAAAPVVVAVCYLGPYRLCCGSPVISYQALLCAWDAHPMIAATSTTVGLSFAAPVLDAFPEWMGPVVIGVCLIVWVFPIMQLRSFPFQRMPINYVYLGAAAGNGVLQLIAALRFAGVAVPVAVVAVTVACAAAEGIVTYVLLGRRRAQIAQALSYSAIAMPGDPITERDKKAYFETLVFANQAEILADLRIGLVARCELFLDFSFPHFLVDNYPSQDYLLVAAHMLYLFPTELQFMGSILTEIDKRGRLSLWDHFLLFTLRRVFVTRQSAISREIPAMLRKITKQALDARAIIRNFWADIAAHPRNLNYGSLVDLERLVHRVESTFCELADKCGNSQDLCKEYSYFLINGAAKFKEACIWKLKADMIERRIRLDRDFVFRSLANCYPRYLLDGIFNHQGRYLPRSGARLTSQTSTIDIRPGSGSARIMTSMQLHALSFGTTSFVSRWRRRRPT
jgi:hypothetical protein